MKILHTADVHLGARLNFLGEKASVHRDNLKQAFQRLIDLGISENIYLFLIAGDLFDSNFPSATTLNFVIQELDKLIRAGIYIGITPGNHDPLSADSIYLDTVWHSLNDRYFHLFTQESPESWEIPELDAAIFSYAVKYKKSSREPLQGFVPKTSAKYKIGLFHGSVDLKGSADNYPLPITELKKLNLDYIALGDWHNQLQINTDKPAIWYAGSPELIASDQNEAGKAILVEIGQNNNVKVRRIQIGQISVVDLHLDLSSKHSLQELLQQLPAKDKTKTLVNLEFTGIRELRLEINESELQDALRHEYYWANVKDNSALSLNKEELEKFSGKLVIGRFLRYLEEYKQANPEAAQSANIAIQKGLKLLLDQNKDVNN